ncbi:Ppx/GppA phosphatase family protein [Paenibacillus taiwanensis]|uniref:Ppx/GppA phosphatase family protein n=1 Tax=Paenibacillus taiwanensis TaxID=401638 RepID=UPI00041DD3B4|nr:Ppx/GppA phosphatase family protein [Paenibacillus taiwanensis]
MANSQLTQGSQPLRHIGIVDVGSNSVRFMLAEVHSDLSFQVVDQWKEVLRLGDEYNEFGAIPVHKCDQLISTLLLFKRLGESYLNCEIRAVATAALRKATNQELILHRIQEETGIQLNIISGEAEAYLDYLAVVSTMNVKDALMLDIGGGSLELVWIENRELRESISLPVGALTLAGEFKVRDQLSADEEEKLTAASLQWLEQVPWIEHTKGLPLIGVGGTMRTIAKMDKAERRYPFDSLHHYEVGSDDVLSWHERLKGMCLVQKEAVPGLAKDRADIIMGSFTLVSVWVRALQIPRLLVSAKGVRDGALFEVLREEGFSIDEPLMFSVHNLMHRLHLNERHAYQVDKLMEMLFDQLQPLHNLGPEWKRIVRTSALLHDSGIAIHHLERERHAFYMILNADLYGLTPREVILSGLIASLDRKQKLNESWKAYDTLLLPQDKQAVRVLGLLLRLAVGFDRMRTSSVESIRCEIQKQDVVLHARADAPLLLEVSEAYSLRTSFRKWLKHDLVIVADVIRRGDKR